jgi:[ribosomal protein S5]-alanine N-acetyltransferase
MMGAQASCLRSKLLAGDPKSMTMHLETAHLHLRPFQLADAPLAYPWLTDPEIMRYMPTGQDFTLEQVEARLARYIAHQAQHGYSRWLIMDRATGEAIGDAGLLYIPATGETELGYRLIKPWWGRGLATEAAQAWLQHAFETLRLPEVIAFSHPDNHASVRVMEKLGLRFLRQDQMAGMDVVVYGTRKPASRGP